MRRAIGFTTMVVVGLLACNAIIGNEASIAYVDGDALAPDRITADASADVTDASELDVSPPDADVSCEAAAFCSDFDPPSASFPFGWSKGTPNDAAAFGTDTTDFVTAPNALAISILTTDPGRFLAKEIDGGRPFDVFFDTFIRELGSGTMELLQVACRPSSTVRVFLDQSGTITLSVDQQKVIGPVLPVRQWVRLTLDMTDSATALFVGAPQQALLTLPRSCLGPFTVSLGLFDANQNTGAVERWTVLFDRVRATVP